MQFDTMKHRNVVILGGGPCGLTIAHKLLQSNCDVILLEADDGVGGTSKTINMGGYDFDLTGHALHLNNDLVRSYLFKEVGLEGKLVEVEREAAVYFRDRVIPYPFQYNLAYLDEKQRDRCVVEFLRSQYLNQEKQENQSFREYCYSQFGNDISKIFMIPYNEKLWATPASKMTTKWMGKFVPPPDRDKILEGAFKKKILDQTGYNARFYYPQKGGIQLLSDSIYNLCKQSVQLNQRAIGIDLSRKRVQTNTITLDYEWLISTIPLNQFLNISNLRSLGKNLRWTVIRAYFFEIPQDVSLKYTWIYLPERNYRAYRFGNFSMFSPSLSRQGKDVLWVECSATNYSKHGLPTPEVVKQELSKIKIEGTDLKQANFIGYHDIDPAYAVYDFKWEDKFNLENYLNQYNVLLAGRYGHWEYQSMEDSIYDGLTTVSKIQTLELQ